MSFKQVGSEILTNFNIILGLKDGKVIIKILRMNN